MADQRAFAVSTDRQDGDCRLEVDRGTAGWAIRGFHTLFISSSQILYQSQAEPLL